jgi:PAS domain S-box-containing protein
MEEPELDQDQPDGLFEEQGDIFRTLFVNNPLPMWIYDVDTLAFLAVNDAMLQFYGYTRKECASMTVKDLRPNEQVPDFLAMLAGPAGLANRASVTQHRKKDGTIVDVEITSHRIMVGEKNARFVLANDITRRRQAEEALRQQEEKYRDLFENANDAIFIVDSELRYRDVNKKAVELLGYSKEQLLAMKILDLVPPEQVPRSSAEFENLRTRGAYEKFTGRVRTRDGRWLDVEISSSAILSNGAIVGSRDIMRDITDRKRMEEEILRAQKLESIGVLAGGIAHDFNNLLTAILGNISLAKLDSSRGTGVYQRLEEAEKASFRAQDLTQQLLTFSKGGAPVKRMVSLKELVQETVSFSLRGSRTVCSVFAPDDLWPAEADEGQLSQVFNNLVINADQAMPEGGTLKISCRNVILVKDEAPPLKEGRYVELSFADQGIGISPEHFEKIFDPYFTTKQKGSGLGLATSYSIVKKHEGHITVASELGAGATFRICLPASLSGDLKERDMGITAASGAGRILVVDDEEMIRDVVGKILGKQGYEVCCARDGQEALDLYADAKQQGSPFHAVIMDLTIPGGMGGEEAMKHLLGIDDKAKVIVSSGYSNDPIMGRFREHGFSGVVSKPYTISKLSQAVKQVLME